MFSHIDRHLNEIVFIKCTNKSCCGEFRSPTVKNILGKSKKLPSPSKNAFFNGHYNTFLQETINGNKIFGDKGQPAAEENKLGTCEICPNYAFKSKTETDRHKSLFHRREKKSTENTRKIICEFEGCDKEFTSQSSLSRHQSSNKHQARDQKDKTKKPAKSKKKNYNTILDMIRQVM